MTHSFETFERASLAPPFFLVVIDFDTKRYALEGPVSDPSPWEAEVVRIRRSGRDVSLIQAEVQTVKATTAQFRNSGFDEWPFRSIVDLMQELLDKARHVQAAAPDARASGGATNNAEGKALRSASASETAAEGNSLKRRRRVNRAPHRTCVDG